MKAKIGDFLVVKGTTTAQHEQHAEIIAVRAEDGAPPYVVLFVSIENVAVVAPLSRASPSGQYPAKLSEQVL